MRHIDANDSLALQPGQLISVSGAAAHWMHIECGRVWVTIEGDINDYWLSGGDRVLLAVARHVVIEADKAFSQVCFLPALQAQPSGTEAAAA